MHDLYRIRQYLIPKVAVLAANALVSSCLDYCNFLLRGLSCLNQHKLHGIKNNLARIITNHRRYSSCYTHSKVTALVACCSTVVSSKLQHWFINFYTVVLLPISKFSCLSAVVPIVPGVVTLIINMLQFLRFTHQRLSQSNILAIVLPLMLLRSGINALMMCAAHHKLPPSGKSSKLTCLEKPIHHSTPCQPCVSLVKA